jgi:hypothetical protein
MKTSYFSQLHPLNVEQLLCCRDINPFNLSSRIHSMFELVKITFG